MRRRRPRATRRGGSGTALGLVRASHPGPVAAVSAAATGYAVAVGSTPKEALRIGAAVLTGQLAIGWHNDWTDAGLDRRSGRRDKPIPNGEVTGRLVGAAAALAGLCCIPASLVTGRRSGAAHLVAVLSGASYNAGLKGSRASFVPYALSFSLLPAFVHRASGSAGAAPAWAPAAAGTLGVAAHLLNVLPDREADRELGVLGLPQRLSRGQSLVLAGGLLVLSSALASFGPRRTGRRGTAWFAATVALGAVALVAARGRDDRTAFRLVLVVGLADVAQLVVSARGARPRSAGGGPEGRRPRAALRGTG